MKRVVFAVAGAGKTTMLVSLLSTEKRTLLLTYTDNNADNLRRRILDRFGTWPENIEVFTWFSFMLSFLIRPFAIENCPSICRLLFEERNIPRKETDLRRYVTSDGFAYHSRAFDFVQKYVGVNSVLARMSQFFDEVLVDEFQDFAGYDFDFIELLGRSPLNVVLTGDFFQHTFDTSRDGSKNKNLHQNYSTYKKRLANYFTIDETSLEASHRCPKAICSFVSDKLGIRMFSTSDRDDIPSPELVLGEKKIEEIMKNEAIKKLFYRAHYKYNCDGGNWGDCKGLSFKNVCVVLNPGTFDKLVKGNLSSLAALTRNKLYVACTRTEGCLWFVNERDLIGYETQ